MAIKEAGGCEVDTCRAINVILLALAETDEDVLLDFELDEVALLLLPLVELEVPLGFVDDEEDEVVDVPEPLDELPELVPLPLFWTIG